MTVFRHERHRPLHAGRWHVLTRRWAAAAAAGAGIRVSGLCRLSDTPSWTCPWDQLGPDAVAVPLVEDGGADAPEDVEEALLCPGHDLPVFASGSGWDPARMRRDPEHAALTDAEFLAGPARW